MVSPIHLADVPDLVESLEKQELETSSGNVPPEVYTKLLALYLLQNDLCNAKFLWKRTPPSIKASHPEVGYVWKVGKHMWNGDYVDIYSSLNRAWSEDIAYIMAALKEEVKKRALNLITKAYSSIPNSSLGEILGVPEEEAVVIAHKEGWIVDKVYTQPIKKLDECGSARACLTDDQLCLLTQYVSFLEN